MSVQDRGIPIIDCMVNASPGDIGIDISHIPKDAFRDEASLKVWPSGSVVEYLFKGAASDRMNMVGDPAAVVEMLDSYGIQKAQIIVMPDHADRKIEQLSQFGDRWFFSLRLNPHDGMRAVRQLDEAKRKHPNIKSVAISPHALYPTIPPNSKEYYPIFAKCIELGLPVLINAGIPGPRVPGWTQDPLLLDEVMWFFPELVVVWKHGGEPWVDMCIKLMLKWPNLYYSTSGFAPKYYPKAIIDYANTRGSDKIIYAGYWPTLSFEDIFGQLDDVALRPAVWPKFLHDNAAKVFRIP